MAVPVYLLSHCKVTLHPHALNVLWPRKSGRKEKCTPLAFQWLSQALRVSLVAMRTPHKTRQFLYLNHGEWVMSYAWHQESTPENPSVLFLSFEMVVAWTHIAAMYCIRPSLPQNQNCLFKLASDLQDLRQRSFTSPVTWSLTGDNKKWTRDLLYAKLILCHWVTAPPKSNSAPPF